MAHVRVTLELRPAAKADGTQPENQQFIMTGDKDWIIESVKSELARDKAVGATIVQDQIVCDDNVVRAELHKLLNAAYVAFNG